MCGIVGVAAKDGMTLELTKAFNDLLYLDTLRGWDSTGVAAIPAEQGDAIVYKRAMPGSDFLQLRAYNKLITAPSKYRALLGHNRAATRGSVTDQNAHPFEHGGITLVHNGSLNYYSNLVPQNSVDVDSEAITVAISQASNEAQLEEVIEKINGAFSLVWHDSTTNYLWFVRNEERPMYWCQILDKDDKMRGFMWASEGQMLHLVASRRAIKIGKIVATEVGRLMAIDLDDQIFSVVYDSKVDTYVKKQYGVGTGYQYGNHSGRATSGVVHPTNNTTYAKQHGSSVRTEQSASQSSAQGAQTSSSGTSSQQTNKQLSLPQPKEDDNQVPRPSERGTLTGRRGFSDAPSYGEYIEFRISRSSYTGYKSKVNHSTASAGFMCGTAVCGDRQLEYPVIIHSVPEDYDVSGVYRGFVIGVGPRQDTIRGERDADMTLYVTFSTCTKVDDEMQEVYQPRASTQHKRSPSRPKSATLKKLYGREVDMKAEYVKKSRACEAQLTEFALSTPWFVEAYNTICYIEIDLNLVPIGDSAEFAREEGVAAGLEDIDQPQFAYGPDGESISYEKFDEMTKHGCAECTMDLFAENSVEYLWIRAGHDDVCLCEECSKDYLDAQTTSAEADTNVH